MLMIPLHCFKSEEYLIKFNGIQPSLKFTSEKEKNKCLLFLDVYVERTKTGYETINVYCKPTFIDQYVRWKCFTPTKRMTSLILILVYRALMICSKNNLKKEIHQITEIYQKIDTTQKASS